MLRQPIESAQGARIDVQEAPAECRHVIVGVVEPRDHCHAARVDAFTGGEVRDLGVEANNAAAPDANGGRGRARAIHRQHAGVFDECIQFHSLIVFQRGCRLGAPSRLVRGSKYTFWTGGSGSGGP